MPCRKGAKWSDPSIAGESVRAPRRFFCAFLVTALIGCADGGVSPGPERTIKVGAIIAFSGDNGQDGGLYLAAIEAAIEDANEELAADNTTFELIFGDSQTDPAAASVLLNSFLQQDVKIVIGPYTSAEVAAVQERIKASSGLLVSPSSTSLELVQAEDHIFRLVPDDSYMVEALVNRMWDEGRRQLAIVYREDSWGRSVSSELERQFTARGGTVISVHSYVALRTSVITQILRRVDRDIRNSIGSGNTSQVAMELVSFDEGALVLEVARDSVPRLGDLAWYGADGFASDQNVVNTPELADFAIQVRYTAPIFAVTAPDAFEDVVQRIEIDAGRTTTAYALLSYDAMRLAARTLAALPEGASYDDLERELNDVIARFSWISGPITLNPEGDRVGNRYDFFAVQLSGGIYSWVRVGS